MHALHDYISKQLAERLKSGRSLSGTTFAASSRCSSLNCGVARGQAMRP